LLHYHDNTIDWIWLLVRRYLIENAEKAPGTMTMVPGA